MDQLVPTRLKFFTTSELAELLGLRPNTLERWRVYGGRGPAFVKAGGRVVYAEGDVLAWIGQQRRANTSQRVADSQSA